MDNAMEGGMPAPLASVSIDGFGTFNFRRDWHGRYRVHEVRDGGAERDVGRIQGYASLKECWDKLFEYTVQPETREAPLLDVARKIQNRNEQVGLDARAAIIKEGIPL